MNDHDLANITSYLSGAGLGPLDLRRRQRCSLRRGPVEYFLGRGPVVLQAAHLLVFPLMQHHWAEALLQMEAQEILL